MRSEFIKRLGELRDGILVAGMVLYVLGYVVWSSFAAMRGLGLLPALDAQYLAAGVAPALLVFVAYKTWLIFQALTEKLPRWLGPTASDWMLVLRMAVMLIALVSFILFWMGTEFTFLGQIRWYLLATFLFALYFLPPVRESDPSHTGWLGLIESIVAERFWAKPLFLKFYRIYSILLGLLVGGGFASLTLLLLLHSSLPLAFGGLRPRVARLELARSEVSAETAFDLGVNLADNQSAVIRTEPVWVLFSGSEFLLVQRVQLTPPTHNGDSAWSRRTYEIKAEPVKALVWEERQFE